MDWVKVRWEVDVEAGSDEEAWLLSARAILQRAEEMQDKKNPHVRWGKYGAPSTQEDVRHRRATAGEVGGRA